MDPVLMRSPVVGKDGLMTREWLRQQIQVQGAARQVSTVTDNVTDIQTASAFDDTNGRDWQALIWEAFLQDQGATPKDFGPAIEDVRLSLSAESPRVYDDSELKAALAGLDTTRVYDDSEVRNALAGLDTAHVYDDGELRNALAGLDMPNRGWQQQLDEVRALVAMNDHPAPLTNLGAWTPYTPTFSGSGSMTVTAGTIYAANYTQIGNLCFVYIQAQIAFGGTTSNTLTVSLPAAAAGNQNAALTYAASVAGMSSGTYQSGIAYANYNAASASCFLNLQANYTTGAGWSNILLSGFYHC